MEFRLKFSRRAVKKKKKMSRRLNTVQCFYFYHLQVRTIGPIVIEKYCNE